jgi:hypothetical protein
MKWYYGPHTHIYTPFSIFNTVIQNLMTPIFHIVCGTRILILPSTHFHPPFFSSQSLGTQFLHPGHRYTCFLFINHQINVIFYFSSNIFHVGYLVLVCTCTYHVHQPSLQSWSFPRLLQVYDQYWHVITPSINSCIS